MKNRRHPPASYARILFRHLRLGEKNCQGYFAGTQLSYEKLMTLDETITHDDLTQIYRNALALSKVENLGLSVGTQLHLPTHGPLGVATFSAPDLRTALTLLGKYGQTRVNFFNTSVSEHPQGLKIHFAETFDLDDLRLFMTEAVLSGLFSAIDFFVGANQFNGHVYFSYKSQAIGSSTMTTLATIFSSIMQRPRLSFHHRYYRFPLLLSMLTCTRKPSQFVNNS